MGSDMHEGAGRSGRGGDAATRILEAADALMSEQGFDGTSVDEVARQAGVNKALVFYYYDTKAKLFDAVIDRYYAAQAEAFSMVVEAGLPPRERIHRLLDGYFDFLVANPRYPRLILTELVRKEGRRDLIRQNNLRMYGLVARALEGLSAQGPGAPQQLYLTFSAMLMHYFANQPVASGLWADTDPETDEGLAARRAHVHWMADLVIDRLERA